MTEEQRGFVQALRRAKKKSRGAPSASPMRMRGRSSQLESCSSPPSQECEADDVPEPADFSQESARAMSESHIKNLVFLDSSESVECKSLFPSNLDELIPGDPVMVGTWNVHYTGYTDKKTLLHLHADGSFLQTLGALPGRWLCEGRLLVCEYHRGQVFLKSELNSDRICFRGAQDFSHLGDAFGMLIYVGTNSKYDGDSEDQQVQGVV